MRNETPEARHRRLSQLRPPIRKGEIRNPTGRGIGKNLWNWAAKLGAPEDLIEPMCRLYHIPYTKLNVEAAILLRLALEAMRGDLKAIELWLDRKYGKVTQQLDVETKSGPLVAILNAPQGDQHVAVKPPANPPPG